MTRAPGRRPAGSERSGSGSSGRGLEAERVRVSRLPSGDCRRRLYHLTEAGLTVFLEWLTKLVVGRPWRPNLGNGVWGPQTPQDGGGGPHTPRRVPPAVTSGACEACEVHRRLVGTRYQERSPKAEITDAEIPLSASGLG